MKHHVCFNVKFKSELVCQEIISVFKSEYNSHDNSVNMLWENTVTFRFDANLREEAEARVNNIFESVKHYPGLKGSTATYTESVTIF